MQINIYTSPEELNQRRHESRDQEPRDQEPRDQDSRDQRDQIDQRHSRQNNTVYNILQSLLQSVSRRSQSNQSNELNDIQIVFDYDHSSTPTITGLTMDQLNLHTQLYVFDIEESTTDNECSICRNNLIFHDICRKINTCGHFFHQSCVDSWLVRNHSCPMCRNPIIS